MLRRGGSCVLATLTLSECGTTAFPLASFTAYYQTDEHAAFSSRKCYVKGLESMKSDFNRTCRAADP
jgi:hypothetical protein